MKKIILLGVILIALSSCSSTKYHHAPGITPLYKQYSKPCH